MPGLYKDEGVVLKTIKLGEADRIVTLFTRGNGKVRAVAKGVRKTKSRFGGRLEPFSHVNLLLYQGRSSLDTITQVELISSFRELRSDYPRLTCAAALADAVEKITPERERAYPVYSLLLAGLHALASFGESSVVPAFLVKLLSVSGYHPQLSVCASCGDRGALRFFSPAMGGVICDGCRTHERAALHLPADRVALLARLHSADFGEPADPEAVAELVRALRHYAEYHLERPLRSFELLGSA
jgi:DNA repair protein RecO (recombination protein O)